MLQVSSFESILEWYSAKPRIFKFEDNFMEQKMWAQKLEIFLNLPAFGATKSTCQKNDLKVFMTKSLLSFKRMIAQ